MRLLLDSSAVAVLAGRTHINHASDDPEKPGGGVDYVALSVVSLDELLRSVPLAATASERARRLSLVERLSTGLEVLPVDLLVVRLHAELWRSQDRKPTRGAHQGKNLAVVGWVAATALAHQLEVWTAEAPLYNGIKGLSVRSLLR